LSHNTLAIMPYLVYRIASQQLTKSIFNALSCNNLQARFIAFLL